MNTKSEYVTVSSTHSRMIIVAVALLSRIGFAVSASKDFENADCKPRPTVVAVDAKHHQYFPHYIILHRCGGSQPPYSPNNRKCNAVKYDEVKVNVRSLSRQENTHVSIRNHTKCAGVCVANPTDCFYQWQTWNDKKCSCDCRYGKDTPPGGCQEGFIWSAVHCKCVCNRVEQNCPKKKVWNTDECGCTCSDRVIRRCARKKKHVNYDTCTCEHVQPISGEKKELGSEKIHLFITLLAIQSCAIVVLALALVHWIRKKRHASSFPPYYCDAPTEGSVDTMSTAVQDDRAQKKASLGRNDVGEREKKTTSIDSV